MRNQSAWELKLELLVKLIIKINEIMQFPPIGFFLAISTSVFIFSPERFNS